MSRGRRGARRWIAPQLEARTDLNARVEALRLQLGRRSYDLDRGHIPDWANYLVALLPLARGTGTSGLSEAVRAYCEEEVYAASFQAAAAAMTAKLTHHFGGQFDQSSAGQIIDQLVIFYVQRLRDTARFVLHLSYTRAACTYSLWAARFEIDCDATNEWRILAEEFPLLLRWLANIERQMMGAIGEMLTRLRNDRVRIAQSFGITPGLALSDLILGLSDRHHDGRMVMKLRFQDGTTLIYKPKPMRIEQAFNDYFASEHEAVGLDPFRVIDAGEYGWAQDVGAGGPLPLADLAKPVGRATALLWLLNATDLHFENVVLSPNGVRVLDLETLLSAPVVGLPSMYDRLWRRHSINSTFLFRGNLGDTGHALHLAAFTRRSEAGSIEPHPGFVLIEDRVVVTAAELRAAADHYVTQTVAAQPAAPVIAEAFRLAMPQVRDMAEHFLRSLSDDCRLRFIARETDFYYQILDRMRQPRFLRDAALLELDLFQLHFGVPQEGPSTQQMHEVVADEIRQLCQGDIPYLSYEAGSTSISTSSAIVPDAFLMSGKDYARQKLKEFEQSDIEEQAALLSIALRDFGSLTPGPVGPVREQANNGIVSSAEVLASELLLLARSIVETAFCPTSSPARWLTLAGGASTADLKAEGGESTLFSGTWGIILGLQAIESALSGGNETVFLTQFLDRQATLWDRAFCSMEPAERTALPGQLGLAGLGGDLLAFSALGKLSNRWGFLASQLHPLLAAAACAIATDRSFDILSGSAGLILGCDQLLEASPSLALRSAALKVQMQAALRLVDVAVPAEDGTGWIIPGQTRPLLGFAHGWAGILAALECARSRTSPSPERSTIEQQMLLAGRYPASLYKRQGSWDDLRVGLSHQPLNYSWCNGKPGFVRGVLTIAGHWSGELANAIDAMIEDLRHERESLSFRFCCGTMGIVDLLLDLSVAFHRPELRADAQRQAIMVLRQLVTLDPYLAPALIPEIGFAGLYQGRAGIGYTAARLLKPDLPSLSGRSAFRRWGDH